MLVTVKEVVRKITEEGKLLEYLPQCLVMDFLEFIHMHEGRKEYQAYFGNGRYETFKNVLLQIFVTNGFDIDQATERVHKALNRGLSSYEQSRRVHIQYPLPEEMKKELPNKKLLKLVTESILTNKKAPEEKGITIHTDEIAAFITTYRQGHADLYNFTLHPYLPHLLEAIIIICLRRKLGANPDSGVRLFYPALQEKGNGSYVPFFTISGSEFYLSRRFVENTWGKVLDVRNDIIRLKMVILSEVLGETVEEVVYSTNEQEEDQEVELDLIDQYESAIFKLPKETKEKFHCNDTSLLVMEDTLLRTREHWVRDGQGSRCATQPWIP